MTTKIKRPILRYHGGKFLLAPWIISHFPKHRVYVEPFGGAASVLLQKPRSYGEVYNDKWDTVVNVFAVMRDLDLALELERRIRLTPFSRSEFMKVGEVNLQTITDPIEKARLTIFRSFAGFGSASTNSKYATGFRCNSNRSGTTPAHDWVNYPDHIASFVDRLKGVVVENKHYAEVIEQHDTKDTLIFLDPPYVHATRNMQRGNAAYEFEMTDSDHVALKLNVDRLRSMVVISGYNSALYDELYEHWYKVEKPSYADGASKRTECLWLNKAAFTRLKLPIQQTLI